MPTESSEPPREFLSDAEEAQLLERDRPDPAQTAEHLRIGRLGEDMACKWLWRRGFRILERNYRSPGRGGEIDVIAERKGRIHIIEVKTRASESLGPPEDRVDAERRRRLRDAASLYLGEFPDGPAAGTQFDVFAQVLDTRNRPIRQQLIEEVF